MMALQTIPLEQLKISKLNMGQGREKTPNWRPGWRQFLALSYAEAGKLGAVQRAEKVAPLFAE